MKEKLDIKRQKFGLAAILMLGVCLMQMTSTVAIRDPPINPPPNNLIIIDRPDSTLTVFEGSSIQLTWRAYSASIGIRYSRLYEKVGITYIFLETQGFWYNLEPITYTYTAPILPDNLTTNIILRLRLSDSESTIYDHITITVIGV